MSIVDRMFVQLTGALYSARVEEGQGLAEFSLIVALVAVLCVASLTVLKGGISKALNSVASNL